ncbi:hypothetical protein MPTK1_4g06090 [Marchantia polymorpha subsp. ruderalis]|uniref:Uncharacterized protein n=2 Tax=Marchantia polymorpha TaxID=3197 RepID=A0AAF6B6V6_MARPO|nr:hypothetical protein MARPO_0114s0045 [Marchantia polymorpha]BBN07740.1 hypothetical protein Mp_4g06090 [Marchantia polymorpha subsp. ruderalis]|eukprot:PTQ31233.1 hypothetical protein MARPO_0114s0045 [Marchantia polymorpha]
MPSLPLWGPSLLVATRLAELHHQRPISFAPPPLPLTAITNPCVPTSRPHPRPPLPPSLPPSLGSDLAPFHFSREFGAPRSGSPFRHANHHTLHIVTINSPSDLLPRTFWLSRSPGAFTSDSLTRVVKSGVWVCHEAQQARSGSEAVGRRGVSFREGGRESDIGLSDGRTTTVKGGLA